MNIQYFFSFVEQLRKSGNVVLYNNIPDVTEVEHQYVEEYLKKEYTRESLNFPYVVPLFDGQAASYAARTMYLLAQLLLFRKHDESEIQSILLPYHGEIDASAMLSADLLFRFLPDFEMQFHTIDYEDEVLNFIGELKRKWHYSAISSLQQTEGISFNFIVENPCLKQLYVDRIIESRNNVFAESDYFKSDVAGVLGIYQKEFWSKV